MDSACHNTIKMTIKVLTLKIEDDFFFAKLDAVAEYLHIFRWLTSSLRMLDHFLLFNIEFHSTRPTKCIRILHILETARDNNLLQFKIRIAWEWVKRKNSRMASDTRSNAFCSLFVIWAIAKLPFGRCHATGTCPIDARTHTFDNRAYSRELHFPIKDTRMRECVRYTKVLITFAALKCTVFGVNSVMYSAK